MQAATTRARPPSSRLPRAAPTSPQQAATSTAEVTNPATAAAATGYAMRPPSPIVILLRRSCSSQLPQVGSHTHTHDTTHAPNKCHAQQHPAAHAPVTRVPASVGADRVGIAARPAHTVVSGRRTRLVGGGQGTPTVRRVRRRRSDGVVAVLLTVDRVN